jgi:hypothetical protein
MLNRPPCQPTFNLPNLVHATRRTRAARALWRMESTMTPHHVLEGKAAMGLIYLYDKNNGTFGSAISKEGIRRAGSVLFFSSLSTREYLLTFAESVSCSSGVVHADTAMDYVQDV